MLASNSSLATLCISLFIIHIPTYTGNCDEKGRKRLDLQRKDINIFCGREINYREDSMFLSFFPFQDE